MVGCQISDSQTVDSWTVDSQYQVSGSRDAKSMARDCRLLATHVCRLPDCRPHADMLPECSRSVHDRLPGGCYFGDAPRLWCLAAGCQLGTNTAVLSFILVPFLAHPWGPSRSDMEDDGVFHPWLTQVIVVGALGARHSLLHFWFLAMCSPQSRIHIVCPLQSRAFPFCCQSMCLIVFLKFQSNHSVINNWVSWSPNVCMS